MGKHDMGSLTARWRVYFNMSDVALSFCLAPSCLVHKDVSFILKSCCEQILDKHGAWRCFKISSLFVLRVRLLHFLLLSGSKKVFYMNNSP